MAFTTSEHKYVQLNDSGVPIIAGTTMKVVELITAQKAYGWSPEEIHFQHPYLSMSQIHSAFAYYWDYKAEIDADIEKRLETAKQLQQTAEPFPLVAKLRSQGQ
ncbi:MAG: DUF433 domain-containing protein [Moorea sp. SIO2B7]|nr:DUF433 domain-containing protein [Moorena sp. SIO2B7]